MAKFIHAVPTILLSLILGIIATSCATEKFELNIHGGSYRIEGLKLNGLNNVEAIGDNSLKFGEGGRASLKVPGMTFMKSSFTMNLLAGEGLRFYIRTSAYDFAGQKGVIVEFSPIGAKITDENGIEQFFPKGDLGINSPRLFLIESEGKYLKFTVDCDDIWFKPCTLPASESIIIEAIGKTRAEIYGINMDTSFEKYDSY